MSRQEQDEENTFRTRKKKRTSRQNVNTAQMASNIQRQRHEQATLGNITKRHLLKDQMNQSREMSKMDAQLLPPQTTKHQYYSSYPLASAQASVPTVPNVGISAEFPNAIAGCTYHFQYFFPWLLIFIGLHYFPMVSLFLPTDESSLLSCQHSTNIPTNYHK